MLGESKDLDFDSIPKEYLQLYPYPAFVLIVPVSNAARDIQANLRPISGAPSFTHVEHEAYQPFDIVWSNNRWRHFAKENTLLECLDIDAARSLGRWVIEEENDSATNDIALGSETERKMSSWETYTTNPPSAIDSSVSSRTEPVNSGESSETATPCSPKSMPQSPLSKDENPLAFNHLNLAPTSYTKTLLLEFIRPSNATFELIGAKIPIWRRGTGGSKAKMITHTFVIITTIPRSSIPLSMNPYPSPLAVDPSPPTPSGFQTDSPVIPKTTILSALTSPSHHTLNRPIPSAYSSDPLINQKSGTPTQERNGFDFDSKKSTAIRFGRDGTVTRPSLRVNPNGSNNQIVDVHDLLENTDWTATPLGPRENWPQSLKTIDLTLIYNEAYAQMMHKHPHIFGMSGSVAWAEIWNALGPLSELVLSGTPVSKEDDFLLFKQLPQQGNKVTEEYHTWMWVPVLQEDGTFGGLWNATIATTSKVLAERRMATIQEMGQRTSIARTMKEFDDSVIDILSDNPRDIPFAALYHVDMPSSNTRRGSGGSSSVEVTRDGDPSNIVKLNVSLAGTVGIPDNHPTTPSTLSANIRTRIRSIAGSMRSGAKSPSLSFTSLSSGTPASLGSLHLNDEDSEHVNSTNQWPIYEALASNRLVMVEDCDSMIHDFPIRVWDELPTAAVVVPVSNESDDGVPSSVLILGLNLRRPFDEDYESFIHLLRTQLSSGIAAVRSYEAEMQRVEELAALDRAKSLLFSNVSHELRTPLTLIAGPLDDLLQDAPEGPKKETLVMARRNVRRLARLVSTLMDVSRLEAGRLKGSFQLVNLGIMTRDLALLFKGAMKQANLQYDIECDTSPRAAYVDVEHWEKVVFNLIGNALKYTMEGFVFVELKYRRDEAVFTVKDSGVGIPASDINLIGERFHRVQSVSRSHEGTGIGLALIKELIKLHGGSMSIDSSTALESRNGKHGSTFSVKVPLGSSHLPSDAIEDDDVMRTTQTTYGQGIIDEAIQWTRDRGDSITSLDSSDGTSSGGDLTSRDSRSQDLSTLYFKKEDVVMLVDDSFDIRRYMSTIFAPFCTVVEARDGLEALRLCQKRVPDLIISDVMMPNLDGFGLLEALKSSRDLSIVPVIMLTARGGDEAKVDGLLAGADDYLAKPFNARELVARAHMQLQLGKRRRALEEAFEQRTSELRALTEYSPVGIFRTDEDGIVNFANTAWHNLSGYPLDEPVDRWADYIADHSRVGLLDFWDKVLSGKDEKVSISHDYQFKNGKWAQLKAIRLEKLGDRAGSGMKGILGCVNDITQRKLNEESQKLRVAEAEQRRQEAEEAKRQQELLIDITSHEIRNPISSLMQIIKTNLLSLQEQLQAVHQNKTPFIPTDQLLNNIEEDLEALESIYQCGLAQERISNDVLSLGKIQLDKLQMFDVEVDMSRETQKVISIFQNEARMKRINLSLVFGEGLEILGLKTVKTDPVRLNQIVTNLLSNAIRFTATSHIRRITLKFDVSLDPPSGDACVIPHKPILPKKLLDDQPIYLYFAVTDTGPGMTEAELEMLFQRFSQVSLKTHTIFGGSGLGLFVCRQITHIMGGKIDVTSQKGKGSTFRFFIKARTCQTASSETGESRDLSKKSSLVKSKKKDIFQFDGKKPHVLIVEDNLINQTVLSRQLRHCNITCDVASNGLEALEKIRIASSVNTAGLMYDCVLMDLEMPVMDGLTALDHIRQEEAAGQLRRNLVIALTGNARQGQIDEAKSRGMDEVVIKPYRLDDLLQKVEEMMKIRVNLTSPVSKAE